jgi:hypothetical protein
MLEFYVQIKRRNVTVAEKEIVAVRGFLRRNIRYWILSCVK